MDYVIQPLTPADEPILWEMLYQALRTQQDAPPREIVRQPEYSRYVEGWGRGGDTGFVAYDAEKRDELLGAVWFRLPPGEGTEETTPELRLRREVRPPQTGSAPLAAPNLSKPNPQFNAVRWGTAKNPSCSYMSGLDSDFSISASERRAMLRESEALFSSSTGPAVASSLSAKVSPRWPVPFYP